MQNKSKRTLQAFRRIEDWLQSHPELFTGEPTPAGGQSPAVALREEFVALVGRVADGAAAEMLAYRTARGSTLESFRLRAELLKHNMQHISDVSRATIPDVVRVRAAFRMSKMPRDAEGLLAAAGAMATAGEEFRAVLVSRGLAPDFVERLRSVAAQFQAAIDGRGAAIAQRRGVLQGIESDLLEGRKLVLALTTIVRQRLRGNQSAQASWEQLKRVTVQGVRLTVERTSADVVRASEDSARASVRGASAAAGAGAPPVERVIASAA